VLDPQIEQPFQIDKRHSRFSMGLVMRLCPSGQHSAKCWNMAFQMKNRPFRACLLLSIVPVANGTTNVGVNHRKHGCCNSFNSNIVRSTDCVGEESWCVPPERNA